MLLSDIEIARMRRALGAGLPVTPPPERRLRVPWRLIGLVALAAALSAAAFLGARWLIGSRAPSDTDEASEGTAFDREMRLRDGTRIALAPEARVDELAARPDEIRLALVRGAIELAVPASDDHQRAVVVVVGGLEVRLPGGRARMASLDGPPERRLEVQVLSGRAHVIHPGRPEAVPLETGDTWSGRAPL